MPDEIDATMLAVDWDDDEREMMNFLLLGSSSVDTDTASHTQSSPSSSSSSASTSLTQKAHKKASTSATLKPSKAKLTAVERRAKHREVVRRSYHRNKAVMDGLKDTVAHLEAKIHALQLERDHPGSEPSAWKRQVIDDLATQSAKLQHEAAQLRQTLQTHRQFVSIAHRTSSTSLSSDNSSDDDDIDNIIAPLLVDTTDEDVSPAKLLSSKNKYYRTPRAAHVAYSSPRAPLPTLVDRSLAFTPLCPNAARAFVNETYSDILAFALSGRAVSTGASVMGWDDKRVIDGATIKFSLRKHFRSETALSLMTKTWLCFSDPICADEKFRGLLTLRILQHVDDDTIVAMRDTTSPDNATIFRCVYLLFRVRTRSGYIICSRSIDHLCIRGRRHPNIEETLTTTTAMQTREGRTIQWVDLFGWFVFDQLGYAASSSSDDRASQFYATGAQVEYGGSLNYGDAQFVPMLALETLAIVSRWESFMVDPVFLLPPSSSVPEASASYSLSL